MKTQVRNWLVGVSSASHPPPAFPWHFFLSPLSQTVTWQSAEQRCDCRSNSSRSNPKRLLIFIKSSSFSLKLFCKRKLNIHYQGPVCGEWRKAHEATVCSMHCVPAFVFACVCMCHRGILSYALLLAMSVISSKNPSDMAWAASQGYSFGRLNSRSLSAPVILIFGSCFYLNFLFIDCKLLFIINFVFIVDKYFNHLLFQKISLLHIDVCLFLTLNDLWPSSVFHLSKSPQPRFPFRSSNIHPIERINYLLLQFRIRHQTITMQ